MNEYTKKQIMEQSRHLFIYGENGIKRREFLQSLETDYPIKTDENAPMAIYMNSFVLPSLPKEQRANPKPSNLSLIATDHFRSAMAENILRKIEKDLTKENINSRIEELLAHVNRLFLERRHSNIGSLEELIAVAKLAREFYEKSYISELTGEEAPNADELKIRFIQIEGLIHYIKEMLNNTSYFGIIIDHQSPFPSHTTVAINELVYSRCNADISMKVAEQPDEWETYHTFTGDVVQATHDYGTVELDDSEKRYIVQQKNKFYSTHQD